MRLAASHAVDLLAWWRLAPDPAGVQLAWLGQAGFLLRVGAARIVIDPYLSDSLAEKYRGKRYPHIRMMPAPFQPSDLDAADLVLCTHAHTDHMDPGTLPGLLAASPQSLVIAPRHSAQVALDRGVPPQRLLGINAGESLDLSAGADGEPVRITAIVACHEEIERDDAGNSRWLGYRVAAGGVSIYHSGDTVPHPEVEAQLAAMPGVDLALLPVNGRDEVRRRNGVPGNLTASEALDYVERFGFGMTVFHHFGLFAFNTADPADLRREIEARDLTARVVIPDPGRLHEFET